jgi:CheY-like chemotaxis protein
MALKKLEMRKSSGSFMKAVSIRHVLYVEDDDTSWELSQLAMRGCLSMHRARTSREAFGALVKNPYDLILMDIELAGSDLNGIEITQAMRGRFQGALPSYATGLTPEQRDLPVVFVTAYQARYKPEDLYAAGGDALVAKPVDFTRLRLVIARLTAKAASEIASAAIDRG